MAHFWTGDDPTLTFETYTQQADKDCYIVFKCYSSSSKTTKLTAVEFSTNGIDWSPMTDLWPGEGEDITSLAASPAGTNHTFAWDSNNAVDLGPSFDGAVKARFTIKNWDNTGNAVQVESAWFTLDFAAPTYTLGWPHGEVISDTTPELHRNASDSSPPIFTKWEIDDDPLFGNANGRKQTAGYSTNSTWTTAALAVTGTWYFRCMCKDSSASANEGAWVSGSFTLSTPIKPYSLTDGVDTVAGFIVDETITTIANRLREYEADGAFNSGEANIVEWVHRKPCQVLLRMIDGPDPITGTFDRYAQCLTWMRAKDLLDIHDIGGSPIGFGGYNITYIPSDWTILTIRVINRPGRINLLYFEVLLEEV